MSNKFEQLLDYLVNEEHDKANELFHEIVVEKSREIYASMIAEETEEDEEVEEAMDDEEEDEAVEESFGDEEESMYEIGGDSADDFVSDVEDEEGADDLDMGADSEVEFGGEEGGEEPATKDDIMDIADALEELKAEFEALLAGEKHEEEENPDIHGGELDGLDNDDDGDHDMQDHDLEDEEDDDETFMREYRETVKKPSNSETNVNTKSPVSSAKGRPNTDAKANNIAQSAKGEDRKAGADGKSLAGNVKGEFTKGVEKNISNKANSSMKDGSDLSKVSAGHGAEKKGHGEQAVNDKNTLPR